MKSILDSSFKYTHSSATDVRKTFARVRLEQQAQIRARQQAEIPQDHRQAEIRRAAARN